MWPKGCRYSVKWNAHTIELPSRAGSTFRVLIRQTIPAAREKYSKCTVEMTDLLL